MSLTNDSSHEVLHVAIKYLHPNDTSGARPFMVVVGDEEEEKSHFGPFDQPLEFGHTFKFTIQCSGNGFDLWLHDQFLMRYYKSYWFGSPKVSGVNWHHQTWFQDQTTDNGAGPITSILEMGTIIGMSHLGSS